MTRRVAIAAAVVATLAIVAIANLLASSAKVRPTFAVGRQIIYRIGYQGEGVDSPAAALGAGSAQSKPQHIFSAISGVLAETVVARDDRSATLLLQMVQPKVTVSDQGAFADALYKERLTEDLTASYAIVVDTSGRIERFAPPAQTSPFGSQFMRTVAATLAIVAPERPSAIANAWDVAEPDVDGTREASYRLDRFVTQSANGSSVGFARSAIVRPRDAFPADGVRRPVVVARETDTGTWQLDGYVQSLHAMQVRSVSYAHAQVGRTQMRLDVEQIAAANLAADRVGVARSYADARLASRDAGVLRRSAQAFPDANERYAAALGNETTEALEGELVTAAERNALRLRARYIEKFAALFALRPAAIASLLPVLRSARSDSYVFAVLLPALGQAATPAAQRALIDLALARERDPKAGRLVAIALGLLPAPIDAIDPALERIGTREYSDSAQGAEFALGTIAAHVRTGEPDRAAAIVAYLERRLRAARSDDARNTGILALGNTESAEIFGAVAPFVSSERVVLRAAAATALRGVNTERGEVALRTLLADSAPYVRLSATTSFRERTADAASYDRLLAMAHSDTDATVRTATIGALWNQKDAHPDIVAFVRSIADSDSDAGVRSAARNLLNAQDADDPTFVAQSETAAP